MRRRKVIRALEFALEGKQAHPGPSSSLEGLDAETAGTRPDGWPHGIHEILGHIVWWQDLSLRWLAGESVVPPSTPEEAWPVGPGGSETWEATAARFREGLERAREAALAEDLEAPMPVLPETTRLECLHVLAAHNSYHLGQIVMLRRLLGAWPPPGGP
jgi:uncharacterized damage-inducible protein DinB